MSRLSLTPVQVTGTGSSAPLDLTAGLVTLSPNTGVSFSWNPQYKLYFLTVTGATTVSVNIGTLIEGEAVTSISLNAATAAHLYQLGPFAQDEETSADLITVDFGTSANVSGVILVSG